jgi:hypothetical protein
MSITPPNWITPVGAIAEVRTNVPANIGLQASGASQYHLAGGQLPPGLSLTSYGSITGIPATPAAAVYNFIVNASNGISASARSFSMAVVA